MENVIQKENNKTMDFKSMLINAIETNIGYMKNISYLLDVMENAFYSDDNVNEILVFVKANEIIDYANKIVSTTDSVKEYADEHYACYLEHIELVATHSYYDLERIKELVVGNHLGIAFAIFNTAKESLKSIIDCFNVVTSISDYEVYKNNYSANITDTYEFDVVLSMFIKDIKEIGPVDLYLYDNEGMKLINSDELFEGDFVLPKYVENKFDLATEISYVRGEGYCDLAIHYFENALVTYDDIKTDEDMPF